MQMLVRAGMALALVACGGSDEAPQPPPDPGLSGGTVYEIFVRSFADSDGDGVGDLPGLTARLDYRTTATRRPTPTSASRVSG
jgi:hypothetical protein